MRASILHVQGYNVRIGCSVGSSRSFGTAQPFFHHHINTSAQLPRRVPFTAAEARCCNMTEGHTSYLKDEFGGGHHRHQGSQQLPICHIVVMPLQQGLARPEKVQLRRRLLGLYMRSGSMPRGTYRCRLSAPASASQFPGPDFLGPVQAAVAVTIRVAMPQAPSLSLLPPTAKLRTETCRSPSATTHSASAGVVRLIDRFEGRQTSRSLVSQLTRATLPAHALYSYCSQLKGRNPLLPPFAEESIAAASGVEMLCRINALPTKLLFAASLSSFLIRAIPAVLSFSPH